MGSRISSTKRNMENGERLQRYKNINIVTVADAKRPPSAQTRPEKLDIILDRPKLTDELTRTHSWNPDDKSSNVFVKEDNPYVLHRHPVAQSTDCVRGKVGYKRGFHVWEVKWPTRQRGTHAVIGIATAKAPLQCTGYQTLVGNNPESWGWDIGRNKLYHNEKNTSKISYPEMNDNNFTTPESIRVILDMEEGTMAFEGNDQYYGVAFRDLKGKTLYPIVSAVWGHCEVEMRYLGGLDPEPQPLMELCRRTIRKSMGKERLLTVQDNVDKLPLPGVLKRYVQYQW